MIFFLGCGGGRSDRVDAGGVNTADTLVPEDIRQDVPIQDITQDLDTFVSSEDRLFFDGGEFSIDVPLDVVPADEYVADDYGGGGEDIFIGDASLPDDCICVDGGETADDTWSGKDLFVEETKDGSVLDVSTDVCLPFAAFDRTCDGIDDDCNGETDEDFVLQPTTCGIGACLAAGVLECIDGTVVDTCVPGWPDAEQCNGVDDNCNNKTDEICLANMKSREMYLVAYTGPDKTFVMPKAGLESIILSPNPSKTHLDISLEYCIGADCSAPTSILAEGIRMCNATDWIQDGCLDDNSPAIVALSDGLDFGAWFAPGISAWLLKEDSILRGEFGTSVNQLGYSAGLISYTEGACVYFHSTFACN